MVEVIVLHSARPGVGKSTIAANLAAVLASRGQRVGVVDTNLQDGGALGVFFGLQEAQIGLTLNDFLLERCAGESALYDVTPPACPGKLMLLPASAHARDLSAVLHGGFRVERVTDDLPAMAEKQGFDTLILDTHHGLQEETLLPMLALALADTLLVVVRLDQRDYVGTGVTIDVAQTLKVPLVTLVANQLAASVDPAAVSRELAGAYKHRVAGLLPYADELAALGSAGLFVLRRPDHPLSSRLVQLADALSGRHRSVAA